MTAPRSATKETIRWLGEVYAAAETGQGWDTALDHLADILSSGCLELRESKGQTGPPLLESSRQASQGTLAREDELSLVIPGHPPLVLVCHRSPFTSQERDHAQILADHLGRAWRLGSRANCGVGGSCNTADGLGCVVLDHLTMGVILVGRGGRIVVANQQAQELLDSHDVLSSTDGYLSYTRSATKAGLKDLVDAIVNGHSPGGAVSLSRPSGKADLQILVVPSATQSMGPDTQDALCALFITDPVSTPDTPVTVLRGLYDLTKAEARVANLLLQGQRLEEASTHLGVTKETVRSQVKRIFDKVGTTRQTDLVRILLTGPGQLRWQSRKRTSKLHPFG